MRSGDLLAILQECYVEKLALRQRHVAVARRVTDYDFNNTYQYVIAREDVHLAWLAAAITDLGGTPEDRPEPDLPAPDKKTDFLPLVRDDGKQAEAFVTRWRGRLPDIGHARHRGMIQVILGETLEHQRFFAQIAQGNEQVLGTRLPGAGTGNGVMGVRWVE